MVAFGKLEALKGGNEKIKISIYLGQCECE
jgi:hypothetical protein